MGPATVIISDLWLVAGWTMVHFLWVGTVFGASAFVCKWYLMRAAANVRYAVALGWLAILSAAPIGIAAWVCPARWSGDHANVRLDAAQYEPGTQGAARLPASMTEPTGIADSTSVDWPLSVSRNSPPEAKHGAIRVGQYAAMWLPWIWIIGAPLTLGWSIVGLAGAERLRRLSLSGTEHNVGQVCKRLARSLSVSRDVAVCVCDRIAAPILVGVVRPAILLPATLVSGMPPDQLEMVLLHELAHVRRWDNLVNLLQRIAESLLFFHPAVWLVSRWVRLEREQCCDDVVLSHVGDQEAYAEALLTVVQDSPSRRRSPFALAVGTRAAVTSGAGSHLGMRIRRILVWEEETMQVSHKFATVILVALATTSLCAGSLGLSHGRAQSLDLSGDSEEPAGSDVDKESSMPLRASRKTLAAHPEEPSQLRGEEGTAVAQARPATFARTKVGERLVIRPGPIKIETSTQRAAFEACLKQPIRTVDFDDIDTSHSDPVSFDSDRYAASAGVIIKGTEGQYVDESFGFPDEFVPSSSPNMYAPGPKATGSRRLAPLYWEPEEVTVRPMCRPRSLGGHRTQVTFVADGSAAAVAGFGAVFIDADFPAIGPCMMRAFDSSGNELASWSGFSGKNGSKLFRGIVALNDKGQPVPAIFRVEIVNGNEWPSVDVGEGVTLDDFVFAVPVATDRTPRPEITMATAATDRGALEVETFDKDVQISVLRDGKEMKILDTKTGNTVTLNVGEYQLKLPAGSTDLQVSRDQITMTRGGKVIARVTRVPSEELKREGAAKWKVADGGNGHTYRVVSAPEGITWTEANRRAVAVGGHLATITSKAENDFVFSLLDHPEYWNRMGHGPWMMGPWIGGMQAEGAREPDGGWQWVTAEPFEFTNWFPGDPNDDCKFSGAVNRICFGSVWDSGNQAASW